MSIPTTPLNESSPAGSDYIRDGDDRIREYKTQNREILEVDHEYPSSGQSADAGKHKQLTLVEQADVGSGSTGYAALGAQTVSGKPELVYTDEDDNDVQITNAGKLNAAALDGNPSTDLLKAIYPIGSIYINATDNTNPGTLLGFGTWVAFGAGRVMVGLDATDTDFDSAEETGGAKTHTLTTDEIPSHQHYSGVRGDHDTQSPQYDWANGYKTVGSGTVLATGGSVTMEEVKTDSTGGGSAHTNVQPYIVVYMWKRTA